MKTKTNTRNAPISEKLTVGQRIVTMLTGNVPFASLSGQVTDFDNANQLLSESHFVADSARATAEAKTVLQNEADAAWDLAIANLAAGVENVAAGNAALILTTGFEVRNDPQPIGPLEAPQNLEPQTNGHEGQVKLRWLTVRGADSYEVQKAPDPLNPTEWAAVASPSSTRVTVEGLPSVTRQWFRVRAIGAAGPSPWSEPAVKTVP